MAVNLTFGTSVILDDNVVDVPIYLGADVSAVRLSQSHFSLRIPQSQSDVEDIDKIDLQVYRNNSIIEFTRLYEDTITSDDGSGVSLSETHINSANTRVFIGLGTDSEISDAISQIDSDYQIKFSDGAHQAVYNVLEVISSINTISGFNVSLASGDSSDFVDGSTITITIMIGYRLILHLPEDVIGDVELYADGTVFNIYSDPLQSMPENLEFTDQEISYNTRLPEVIDFDVPGDYTDGVALYFFWEFSAKSTGFNGLNHGTQQFIYEGENITHFGSPDVFGYIGNNTSKSDFAFPLPSTLGSDWETANESSEYKFIAVRLIPDDTATGIVSVTLRDGVIRGPRSFDIDDITMVSGQQSGSTGQQSGARSVENEITFTRTYESDAGTNGANVGRDEFGITNGDNTVLYIGHISQALALSNLDEDNSIVITQGSNEVIYELDSEDSITATHFSVEATLSSGDPSLLIDGSSVSITIRPPTPPPPPTIQQVGPLNIVVLEPYSVEIQLGGEIDSNGVEVEGLWKEFSYNYNPTTKIITVSGTADELLSDGEWLITVTGPGGTSELITVYNFIHQTLVIHEPVVRTFYKGVDVRFFIRIDNIFEQVSVRGLLLGLGWEAGEQESDDPDNPLMGIWIYGNVPDSEFTQDFGRAAIEAVNTAGIVTGGFDYNIEDANPASLSITASDSTISSGSEVTFTFTFGRDIDGFDLEDILLSAGEIGELTKISNTVWELTATAPSEGEGEIEVSVDANVVNQGNDAASLSVDYEIDRAGLSISFTAQTRPVISSQSIVVTFTFDRNVTFTMNNISNTDSNVTLSNFQNVNGRVYRATATAPASGIGRFSLFVVEDTVPELNESASSGSIYYAPSGDAVLNITSIQVGPGSSGTFGTSTFVGSRTHTIQFEFDRFVSGLNLSEISAVYDPVIPTNLPSPLQDLSFSFSGLSNLSSGGNSDGSYIYQATIRVPRILGSGYDSYIDIDGGTTTVSLASDRVVPGNNADSIVIDWG